MSRPAKIDVYAAALFSLLSISGYPLIVYICLRNGNLV